MKKKFIVVMMIMLLFVSFAGKQVFASEGTAVEDKVLKMATNASFPPYEFMKDGKIVGIDVEIANAIADKLGYKLEIMDMDFNTIISAVESGKANIALAGMTVTEERKESVNFSTPYANSVQIVIIPNDSDIKSLDDLKGKKIGTQLGTTGDIYAKGDYGEEAVQSFDKFPDAILALKSGQIDLVMVDETTGKALIKNNPELKILETPYANEDYAIAVTKDNPKLLEEINGVLKDMKDDGSLDAIISKYIDSGKNDNKAKVLNMATNASFPPYEFIKDGKIVGIDVEIASAIADKLGYELNIMDMDFNTIISAVESGKANIALAGMTVTDERKESVNFSTPYAKSVQVVIVTNESDIKTLDDIEGKKIGTQLGTTGDIYAQDDYGEEAVQSFDKFQDAVMALKSGQIDLVMVDDMTGKSLIENNPDLKILDTPYADEDYAIAVTKDDPELLDQINTSLAELKDDGTLDKIVNKYIAGEQKTNVEKLSLSQQIKKNLVDNNNWKYLARGLKMTLYVTVVSLIIGFILGLILALIKLAHKDLNPSWSGLGNILLNIGNAFATGFVSFIRGTPTMIQLLIMFNVILAGVKNLPLVAIATFGINSSAYMSEIFRGGFNAVNKGEIQAARALGLTYYQTFKKIVLPQSLKINLPALGNETITLLKETSIAGAIGLLELTRGANIIISNTFSALVPYLATALIYYGFVLLLEKLFKTFEGKMTYVKD